MATEFIAYKDNDGEVKVENDFSISFLLTVRENLHLFSFAVYSTLPKRDEKRNVQINFKLRNK